MGMMVRLRHRARPLPGLGRAGIRAGRHNGPVRVVSLVPSVTETLLSWDVRPVAVTRFCAQPHIRRVGGTKDPDVAAIVSLSPDLVVMDREENRVEDHDSLTTAGVPVHVTAVQDLDDVEPTLTALAARIGVETPTVPLRSPARVELRAFIPIWRRPWMALGTPTYGSSLLRRIGVANVFHDLDMPYPVVTLDDAAARHPDLVAAPDEPFPFGERHRAELMKVAPVWFVDGRDLLWWGARTSLALERLAARLETWIAA